MSRMKQDQSSTNAGESSGNLSETTDGQQTPPDLDDRLIRSRVNSRALDWKVGSLFVVGVMVLAVMLPEGSNNMDQIKPSGMVPLLNPNFKSDLTTNFNTLKNYCLDYDGMSDQKSVQFYNKDFE